MTAFQPIRRNALRASQFPHQVPDANGIVHKPPEWDATPPRIAKAARRRPRISAAEAN